MSSIENLLSFKSVAQMRSHTLQYDVYPEIVSFSRKFLICKKICCHFMTHFWTAPQNSGIYEHLSSIHCILLIRTEMIMLRHNSTTFWFKIMEFATAVHKWVIKIMTYCSENRNFRLNRIVSSGTSHAKVWGLIWATH